MKEAERDRPGQATNSGGLLWLLLVCGVTALVYARSLGNGLVYDDRLLITRNPLITDLGNVFELFTRPYWDFLDPGEQQIGYWRPLSAIAQSLAWTVGDGSPAAFHGLCVSVHLAATAAVFFLARRLSGSVWVGAASALLFGLHPTQVEAVAWVSALNDPLCGVFAILSLHAFVSWRDRGSPGRPWLSAVFFALSLLAKELGVSVLPMLLAIDLGRRLRPADHERGERDTPGGRFAGFRGWRRAYTPFGVVLAGYVAARIGVFGVWAGLDRITTDFGVGFWREQLLRLELVGGALELLAWPAHLNLFRPFQPTLGYGDPVVLTAALATALALGLSLWLFLAQKRPELAAALMVSAALTPIVLRIESLGRFPLAERFLYLPAVGFCLLLACALVRLPRLAGTLALLSLASLYGWRSYERQGVWKDEETLFANAVLESPRSPYVYWGYGRVLLEKHEETRDPAYLARAFEVFESAQALLVDAKQPKTDVMASSKDFYEINLGLGWCYLFEARQDHYSGYSTAITLFEELARRVGELEDEKLRAEALGLTVVGESLDIEQVYTALGTAQAMAGDYDAALTSLNKALLLNRRYPEAHYNKGKTHEARGELELALHHYEKAAELRPGGLEDELALAQLLQLQGETDRAEAKAEQLLERFPDEPEPMLVLAAVELARGRPDLALSWTDRALQVDPTHGYAFLIRGQALVQSGDTSSAALQAFRQAALRLPDVLEANYLYGVLLDQSGAPDSAIPYFIRAYALSADDRYRTVILNGLLPYPFRSPEPLLALARIESRRDRLDLAETWLDRALALAPDHGESLLEKGRVLRRQERTEEALDLMRRATEILADDFLAASELAAFLADLGRTDEAIAEAERAMELEPPPSWGEELRQGARERLSELLTRLRAEAEQVGPSPTAAPGGG